MRKETKKFWGLTLALSMICSVAMVPQTKSLADSEVTRTARVAGTKAASALDTSVLKINNPSIEMLNYTSVCLNWGKYSDLNKFEGELIGFVIKYSTDKSMKNAKKIEGDVEDFGEYVYNDDGDEILTGFSCEIEDLKKGKTYYFTIQASYDYFIEDDDQYIQAYGPVSNQLSVTLKETKPFVAKIMKSEFKEWIRKKHKADKYQYVDVNGDKIKDLVLLKKKGVYVLLYNRKEGTIYTFGSNDVKNSYLDIKKHRLVYYEGNGFYDITILNHLEKSMCIFPEDGYYMMIKGFKKSFESPMNKSKYENLVKKYVNKKHLKKQNIGFSWKKYSKASVLKDIG